MFHYWTSPPLQKWGDLSRRKDKGLDAVFRPTKLKRGGEMGSEARRPAQSAMLASCLGLTLESVSGTPLAWHSSSAVWSERGTQGSHAEKKDTFGYVDNFATFQLCSHSFLYYYYFLYNSRSHLTFVSFYRQGMFSPGLLWTSRPLMTKN